MAPLVMLLLGGTAVAVYKKTVDPSWSPISSLLATPSALRAALARVRHTSVPTPDPTSALDPNMTSAHVDAANKMLVHEVSHVALREFAQVADKMGFTNTAHAVNAKADAVADAKAVGASDADVAQAAVAPTRVGWSQEGLKLQAADDARKRAMYRQGRGLPGHGRGGAGGGTGGALRHPGQVNAQTQAKVNARNAGMGGGFGGGGLGGMGGGGYGQGFGQGGYGQGGGFGQGGYGGMGGSGYAQTLRMMRMRQKMLQQQLADQQMQDQLLQQQALLATADDDTGLDDLGLDDDLGGGL